MKKSKIFPSLVLGCICLVAALLLSLINSVTAPRIEALNADKANEALRLVLPEGKNFKKIDDLANYPEAVTEAHSADGGFVFRCVGKGLKGDIVIMVGVDTEGKITGIELMSSEETKSYSDKVYSQVTGTDGKYKDQTLDTFDPFLVGGSTYCSNGVADAVKAALQAFAIANGATVDTRTPEQILQDNCNAALGTTGKTFARFFESYSAFGTAEVYTCDSGAVIKSGDFFVGYLNGSTSAVGTPGDDALAATKTAYDAYASLTQIDLADYEGVATSVKSVYKTANGEYMLSVSRKGFSYATAPMVIEILINSDGVIVSCVTVSHSESYGYGYICGTPEYYEQYVGKTIDNYSDVPAINPGNYPDAGLTAGATETSNGYKNAVRDALRAFKLLTTTEGGNA